jgi:glycosylphosphatidylinositol transamidase (GPIT) subunit GPI8
MPNYQNAKIYKLWSPEGDDIYIGSTTVLLCTRKAKHKHSDNCSSKILFEKYNDVRIELLECCPCDNKEELAQKEGEYIRNNTCVNKRISGRTRQEWREENKEDLSGKKKDYYQKNKEDILEKAKEYHQMNKEHRNEYKKEWYEKNKDYVKETNKKWRDDNKEKIKEIKSIRVICECGLEVKKDTIARHKRTQRHIGNLK